MFIRYDSAQSPEVFEKDNRPSIRFIRADHPARDRFIAGSYRPERGHEAPSRVFPKLRMCISFPGMTGGTFSRPMSSFVPWISPRMVCFFAGTGMGPKFPEEVMVQAKGAAGRALCDPV